LSQRAIIDEDHGVELDLTCGFFDAGKHIPPKFCRDVFIGKSIIEIDGGLCQSTEDCAGIDDLDVGLGFKVFSNAGSDLYCDIIIVAGRLERNGPVRLSLTNKTTDQYYEAVVDEKNHFQAQEEEQTFLEYTVSNVRIGNWKDGNILWFSGDGLFYFAYALVIPK
jgi:hypothetical protein